MRNGPDLAQIAALIGDPARANMLTALMSGKALTPSELAIEAGLTRQTVSSHLSRLQDGGLISTEKQGRHRYVRLSGEDVAAALEGLMALSSEKSAPRVRTGPKDAAMRRARICYDHLAGELGVWMYDQMIAQNWLTAGHDGIALSEAGETALASRGLDIPSLKKKKRPLCRACLDWSERRQHLAGSVGAALLDEIQSRNWARREKDSRVVTFTREGEMQFRKWLEA